MPEDWRLIRERRRQQAQVKAWSVVLRISAFFCWGIGCLTAISQAAVLARRLRTGNLDPLLSEAIGQGGQSLGTWQVLLVLAVALLGLLVAFVVGAVLMGLAHALLSLGRIEVQTRHPPRAWESIGFPELGPGPYSQRGNANG